MSAGHTARFYQAAIPEQGFLSLDPERSRHAKALRLREGEPIELFDGTNEYNARFASWEGNDAKVEVMGKSEPKGVSGIQVTLAIAFPKGKHADTLVQKATEVGVSTMIPLVTKRTVVDPGATKLERLREVAITACEQSGRTTIPAITSPFPVDKLLATCKDYDACVIADASGTQLRSHGKKVLALVGPEGGFTDEEVEAAKRAGCSVVNLGNTTLRTETAGIVLTALLARGASRA